MSKERKAVMTLVIEYDTVPDRADLEEIIDHANGLGAVTFAKVTYTPPLKREILRGKDRSDRS